MKHSDFPKTSPTHAVAPVQRTGNHQNGTFSNDMNLPYSKHILQLQRMLGNQATMQLFGDNGATNPIAQRAEKDNDTGMPNELKSGLESMSGYDLSDVKIHYNSDKPAALQAHAYAQGNDIYVGPGQEMHLPHEGWHIVQQRQSRVQPTTKLQGAEINDDSDLEKEADIMGAKALQRGSSAGEGSVPRTSTIRDKAMQLLSSSNTNLAITQTKHVIQRALTLDNPDFSEVNAITKLGGNAEGAYLIDDNTGKVVVKVAGAIDGTVMAYNLAKDFNVNIPSARYLKLDTEAGQALIAKASEFNKELEGKLNSASAITIWEFIPGDTLSHFKGKVLEDEQVKTFRENPENFVELGRMLVFDVAILNGDRFKVGFGAEANSGNLMIADNHPVGLDQDFAHVDDTKPGETLNDYSGYFVEMLKPKPEILAKTLVEKMIVEEYLLFTDMEEHISKGIQQGINILRGLANEDNLRLEQLIEWSKSFESTTDLEADKVREYWTSLLA